MLLKSARTGQRTAQEKFWVEEFRVRMDVARGLRNGGLVGSRNKVHACHSAEALEMPFTLRGVPSLGILRRGVRPKVAHAKLATTSEFLGVCLARKGPVGRSRVSAVGLQMPPRCRGRSHLTPTLSALVRWSAKFDAADLHDRIRRCLSVPLHVFCAARRQ